METNLQVQWHTGMLLLAQHFQQQNRYHHYQLQQLLKYIYPYFYGLIDIEIDQSIEHQIIITKLEAVMPNLIPIMFTYNPSQQTNKTKQQALEDGDIIEINFAQDLETAENGLYYIYLVMPDLDTSISTAYIPAQTQPITDVFTDENQESITVLKPNLKLIFGKNPPIQTVCIPILEIEIINKQYRITNFEGTFLKWQANSKLLNKLQNLIQQIRNKIIYWQNSNEDNAYHIQLITYFTKGMILLEEQISAQAHPYEVFKALLILVANICPLQKHIHPKFEYNHNNITQSFNNCFDFIKTLLDIIQDSYIRTHLMQENKYFISKINENYIYTLTTNQSDTNNVKLQNIALQTPTEQFFIFGAKKFTNSNLLKTWINTCVIGSESKINQIMQSRILGARRKIIDYMPNLHIKSSDDYIFFLVYLDPNFINLADEKLILFNENDDTFPDFVELYTSAQKTNIK